MSRNQLLDQIVEIRHVSPQTELELCEQLIEKYGDDDYCVAFAKTYMADAKFSIGNILEAKKDCISIYQMCSDKGYTHLQLFLCNLLGIIYGESGNEQTSLDYYFEGLKKARMYNNKEMLGTFLANIGVLYVNLECYDKAYEMFEQGYNEFLQDNSNEANIKFTETVFLIQVANLYLHMGDLVKTGEILDRYSRLETEKNVKSDFIRAEYYLKISNIKEYEKYIDRAINGLHNEISQIDKFNHGKKIIEILLETDTDSRLESLVNEQYELAVSLDMINKWLEYCDIEIAYWKKMGDTDKLLDAYKFFLKISQRYEVQTKGHRVERLKKRIELQSEIQKHESMQKEKEALTSIVEYDELTLVYNRKGISKYVKNLFNKTKEDKSNLSVIMIDIDFFKQYNDAHGHIEGDVCLKKVAGVIKNTFSEGVVGRYGGDEFIVAIKGKIRKEIINYLKAIKEGVTNLALENRKSEVSDVVTVTIGAVNGIPGEDVELVDFVRVADNALYEIKKSTRNGYYVVDYYE